MAQITVLRYDRSRFYRKITINEPQLDFVRFEFTRFNRFITGRQVDVHTVKLSEEGRLDLISHQEYGTTHLWWVIAMSSGIIDPLLEVTEGRRLIIPSIVDIEEFVRESEARSRSLFSRVELPSVRV